MTPPTAATSTAAREHEPASSPQRSRHGWDAVAHAGERRARRQDLWVTVATRGRTVEAGEAELERAHRRAVGAARLGHGRRHLLEGGVSTVARQQQRGPPQPRPDARLDGCPAVPAQQVPLHLRRRGLCAPNVDQTAGGSQHLHPQAAS